MLIFGFFIDFKTFTIIRNDEKKKPKTEQIFKSHCEDEEEKTFFKKSIIGTPFLINLYNATARKESIAKKWQKVKYWQYIKKKVRIWTFAKRQ